MLKTISVKKKLLVIATELVMLLFFILFSIGTYSKTEITFTDDVMQIQDIQGKMSEGGYLDLSFTDKKAVVTPAFNPGGGYLLGRGILCRTRGCKGGFHL